MAKSLNYNERLETDTLLIYDLQENTIMGGDGECMYAIKGKYLNNYVMNGYCDHDIKTPIEGLNILFKNQLKEIGITQNELIDYATYYFKTN